MAKKPSKPLPQQQYSGPAVKVLACPLFHATFAAYKQKNPAVIAMMVEFIKFKRANPTELYGTKDRAFTGNGSLRGYIHAGLTRDVSIVYTIEGKNPNIIKLYGIYSHDELGTGTPAKDKLIAKNAAMFSKQSFGPLTPLDESSPYSLIHSLL